MPKFMFVYRDSIDPATQPSAEEMQQFLALWGDWFAKCGSSLIDGGDALLPTGRVLKPDGEVVNGPFVEAKEVIGGFTIVQAEHYEAAVEMARTCPIAMVGGAIEIREFAGYNWSQLRPAGDPAARQRSTKRLPTNRCGCFSCVAIQSYPSNLGWG